MCVGRGSPTARPLLMTPFYAWLPPVLLAIAAYGGTRPIGASTQAWREAAERLRHARLLRCEVIDVQLVDEDAIVASSKPPAQWLPGDVLAIRREAELSFKNFDVAAQSMLDRQDLLKDLRLVLGALDGCAAPTPEQIETALELAEIDAQSFADIRHRWAGTISMLVDRIRPLLVVLGIPADGLEAAAADTEHLPRGWVTSSWAGA
jgi:hypothetical protein